MSEKITILRKISNVMGNKSVGRPPLSDYTDESLIKQNQVSLIIIYLNLFKYNNPI